MTNEIKKFDFYDTKEQGLLIELVMNFSKNMKKKRN